MLTETQIKQFITLYKARFGKELTEKEATVLGMKLLNLIKAIHKPITQ